MVRFMRGKLVMGKGMGKVYTNMQMVINLKGNGKMIISKWVNIFLKVEKNLRVDLKMGKWYLGQCFMLMGRYIKGSLKEGREMGLEHIQTN